MHVYLSSLALTLFLQFCSLKSLPTATGDHGDSTANARSLDLDLVTSAAKWLAGKLKLTIFGFDVVVSLPLFHFIFFLVQVNMQLLSVGWWQKAKPSNIERRSPTLWNLVLGPVLVVTSSLSLAHSCLGRGKKWRPCHRGSKLSSIIQGGSR